MSSRSRLVLLVCLVTLFGSLLAVPPTQAQALRTYSWQGFSFQYPSSWSIVLDDLQGDTRHLKLVNGPQQELSLLLTLQPSFPEPDADYWRMPVMVNVSFGSGLALNLAGSHGEQAIALTYGSINIYQGWVLTARFAVTPLDSPTFYFIESFHGIDRGKAFMGSLLFSGTRGQVMENPAYSQQVAELYTIVQSLTIE